jgi:hypothetical protein
VEVAEADAAAVAADAADADRSSDDEDTPFRCSARDRLSQG